MPYLSDWIPCGKDEFYYEGSFILHTYRSYDYPNNKWIVYSSESLTYINGKYYTLKEEYYPNGTFFNESRTYCESQINNSKEQHKSYEIRIYPNPCFDKLSIIDNNNELRKIEIYDISGRVIPFEYASSEIDVSLMPAGFYLLRISSKKSVRTLKFQIVRN